jgi:RNA polymerase sigma factor (sigma-70 family)
MMNAAELLSEFRQRRSEQAFAELVRRFGDLVFSVAKRRLNNAALAEEAAQSVFLRLAKSAPNITSEPELIGWLHRTTLHAAIDLWRAETRRRAREEKAAAMQSIESQQNPSALALVVDEALDELSDSDRQTLLLRFFDGRKMRELGEHLGITEDAAKMRVTRSLDRLRERLAQRGIQTTSVLLATFLTEQAISAIPAAITASILQAVAPFCSGTSWLTSLAPLLNWKFAALVGGLSLAIVLFTSQSRDASQTDSHGAQRQNEANQALPKSNVNPDLALNEATIAANPMILLENVARARRRIFSGNIQYEQAVEFEENDVHGAAETNTVTGQIIFDGGRQRLEKIGFEYSYVGVGEAGERKAKLIKEKKMNHGQAMRAGLITKFESRHVAAFDGAVIMDYWENNGRPVQTAIRDPNDGGGVGLFDPRCLGLRTFTTSTLESGLSLNSTNATLVGKEHVEGAPAWHLRVKYYDTFRDYWISVAQPDRLLKHIDNGDIITSRYAADRPRDPFPIDVVSQTRHQLVIKFHRTSSEYNIPVDPAIFTLAGLGMPRGTWVVDSRTHGALHSHLGYWTGSGLVENEKDISQKQEPDPSNTDAPTLLQQVAILDSEPQSSRGLDAALWIIFNTPDGSEVEKAGKVILENHLQSTNVLTLATRLQSLLPRCAKPLLTEILSKNPEPEIRATACFSLAQICMDEAEFGANPKGTAEAKSYFQRYIREFSTAGKTAIDKKYKSEKAIEEIDRGFIGQPAPYISATTTTGETLEDIRSRGRATLILFRSSNSKYEAEEYRKVYDKVSNRDVTFVTIFGDSSSKSKSDNVEDQVEASAPGWLQIRNGESIRHAFYVQSWPSIVLIDKHGIIRGRGLRGDALEKAILAAVND